MEIVIQDVTDKDWNNGDLVIELEPIIEDTTFTHHSNLGILTRNVQHSIVDFNILGATFFLVGNNGQDIGEIELSHDEVLEIIPFEELLKHYNSQI